jgi:hypothetical protein
MAANAIAPPKNLFIFPIGDAQLAQVDCDFPAFFVEKYAPSSGRAGSPLPAANVSDGAHGVTRPAKLFCAAERIALAAARRFFHAPVNGRTTHFHFEQTRRRA